MEKFLLAVITTPVIWEGEEACLEAMLEAGLEKLHIRKPGVDVRPLLARLGPRWGDRLVLHGGKEALALAKEYQVGQVHAHWKVAGGDGGGIRGEGVDDAAVPLSASLHSWEEAQALAGGVFEYVFLSPLFDSISKPGYLAGAGILQRPDGAQPCKVIGLGGINLENIGAVYAHGWDGAALLGYIWERPEEAVQKFVEIRDRVAGFKAGSARGRPSVLVIAGFDQSGGAGILADIKTLEMHEVYGYAACTGLTFQNERTMTRISWNSRQDVFEQIDLCFASCSFEWVKIGVAESLAMLQAIVTHVKQYNPLAKIILDPVIRASSGKDFWEGANRHGFDELARQCWLVTPNWEEIGWLYPGEDIPDVSRRLSALCHLYLKGGHHPQRPGRDYLWSEGKLDVLEPCVSQAVYAKHGSGCVLSSALAENLAKGYPLKDAARLAKRYVEQFLTSNTSLLGWHKKTEGSLS